MSFKKVQAKISKSSGEGMKAAGAMLAAQSRKASPEARKKNPKLNKVSGMPPMKKKAKGDSIFHMPDL